MGDHNAEARQRLLKQNKAMPNPGDGPPRFPINDEADLRKAIKLAGNASGDPSKVRAFIIKRAKALGRLDLVPDDWTGGGGPDSDDAKSSGSPKSSSKK